MNTGTRTDEGTGPDRRGAPDTAPSDIVSGQADPSYHHRSGIAMAVAALCGLLAVASLVVSLILDARGSLSSHTYEDVATALVWSALAALLAVRVPRHRFVGLFTGVAVSASLAVATGGYWLLAQRVGWPGGVSAAWVSDWVWVPGTFLPVTLLPLWFPDGWARRRWRPVGWLVVAGIAAIGVGSACAAEIQLSADTEVPNPLGFAAADGVYLAGSIVTAGTAVASLVALVLRTARSAGDHRRQLAPVTVAVIVSLGGLLGALVWPVWGPVIQVVVMPLLPLSVVVAILRYRLYDLEIVVRRSLLFVALSALVVAGYVLLVQAIAALLHRRAGLPESLVATALVALAFQPARLAVQRVIGRWLYGDRDTPLAALTAVSQQLIGAADPDVALAAAVRQLRVTLRLPWLAIDTPAGRLAQAGDRPRWTTDNLLSEVPLVHLGASQGRLVVAPRAPGEPLAGADLRTLGQLAVPIAAVVAARRLIDELRQSREQVVLAREEERRRLRRDLHDGLGPLLSALTTQADVAALRLARSPTQVDRVAAVLDQIRHTGADAIAGLRRVVEDLRPAAIEELGLDGALHQLCAAMSLPGRLTVNLHATPTAGLPAATELAVYRIAGEAVTNAVRHSRAHRVDVLLDRDEQALVLQVRDDGTGFEPRSVSAGVGLESMRQRAEEIGGTLHVSSGPAGSTVRAVLQLPGREPACG